MQKSKMIDSNKLGKSQVMLRLLEGICSAVEITNKDDHDCSYGFQKPC